MRLELMITQGKNLPLCHSDAGVPLGKTSETAAGH